MFFIQIFVSTLASCDGMATLKLVIVNKVEYLHTTPFWKIKQLLTFINATQQRFQLTNQLFWSYHEPQ